MERERERESGKRACIECVLVAGSVLCFWFRQTCQTFLMLSSFSSTKYTSPGANLPTECFSEMAPLSRLLYTRLSCLFVMLLLLCLFQGSMMYMIRGDYPAPDFFALDPLTGVIHVKRDLRLDSLQLNSYTVMIGLVFSYLYTWHYSEKQRGGWSREKGSCWSVV